MNASLSVYTIYYIHPNVRQFFPNSSTEKLRLILKLCTKLIFLCICIFLKTGDCEAESYCMEINKVGVLLTTTHEEKVNTISANFSVPPNIVTAP